jgi:hypothetical protein
MPLGFITNITKGKIKIFHLNLKIRFYKKEGNGVSLLNAII